MNKLTIFGAALAGIALATSASAGQVICQGYNHTGCGYVEDQPQAHWGQYPGTYGYNNGGLLDSLSGAAALGETMGCLFFCSTRIGATKTGTNGQLYQWLGKKHGGWVMVQHSQDPSSLNNVTVVTNGQLYVSQPVPQRVVLASAPHQVTTQTVTRLVFQTKPGNGCEAAFDESGKAVGYMCRRTVQVAQKTQSSSDGSDQLYDAQ